MKKKKLLIYIIALAMTAVLSVNLLYAWFLLNKQVDTSLTLSVVGTEEDVYANVIKITQVDENTLEEKEEMLMPGRLNVYKIEITNNTQNPMMLDLIFGYVEISPATLPTSRNYDSYMCDLYETDGNETVPYFPDLNENSSADILRAMSEPVTNALSFFCGDQTKLEEFLGENKNYNKTMLTEFGDDSVDPSDENYKEFVTGQKKKICTNRSIDIETGDGTNIMIQSGSTATVFFAIYFDGEVGTDGVFDNKQLLMKNSNGFMAQEVKVALGLSNNY